MTGTLESSLWTPSSFVLFDDSRVGSACAGGRLYRDPVGAVEARLPSEVGPALEALDAVRRAGQHAVGFCSYELGYCLEPRLAPLLPSTRAVPLLSFGIFDPPEQLNRKEVSDFLEREAGGADFRVSALRPVWTEEAYGARFRQVRALIHAGDVYQINLTFPLQFELEGHPARFFEALRRNQRAGYGAYLALKDLTVLSLSPELFLRTDGPHIETRPMKGTAPRGADSAADRTLRDTLAADPKNRAENLMIVDLLRNDLGRVAVTGSVTVDDLFHIETYPTLHQMVTTVSAILPDDVTTSQLVGALFPSGSITGAPKIRAMEIIRTLEEHPRGIYCGAIGAITPDYCMFNVAIRTLTINACGTGTLSVGSGLVADSDLASEYAECLLKSRFVARDDTAQVASRSGSGRGTARQDSPARE